MPPEFYLGTVAVVILIVLLGSLFRGGFAPRRRVWRKGSETEQLANELSRIADALEKLAVHLGASPPRVVVPSALPLEKTPEKKGPPVGTEQQEKTAEPTKPHVSLSMFGR